MISTMLQGFLLGLATGTTCLITCGPIYVPYLMQYDRNLPRSILAVLELSAGRFVSYLVIGAAAGYLGKQVYFEGKSILTASAYALCSVFLLVTAFRTHRRDRYCPAGRWAKIIDRPLVLGILTGINLCPPFILALSKAFAGSGAVAGIALFAAFFAGTTLFLLPVSGFGLLGGRKLYRSIARWGALAVSVWFFTLAGLLLRGYFQQ